MKNLKLTIEYNGSEFSGWQKQKGKRTVQQELETAFSLLTGEDVVVEGSGRTDKGVHAFGQVASCQIESTIPVNKIKMAINNLLPEDIKVTKVEKVDDDFHARFSAKEKTYEYYVQIGGDRCAISHNLLAHYPFDVDFDKVVSASKLLIGKHDFHGFCSSQATVTNFEREIFDISIKKKGKVLKFSITGNGFLYNMVRIIVGTLLDCGRGKLSEEDIKTALKTGERKYAGKTMPACGLYLKKVVYKG